MSTSSKPSEHVLDVNSPSGDESEISAAPESERTAKRKANCDISDGNWTVSEAVPLLKKFQDAGSKVVQANKIAQTIHTESEFWAESSVSGWVIL